MSYNLPGEAALVRKAKAFGAKKHLGQHFLVDPEYLSQIADALEITPGAPVLEIGPGLGFLTQHLLSRQAEVTAVELDSQAVQELSTLDGTHLNVVHADFLRYDLGALASRYDKKLRVAGNVPYQITAPILHHLFGEIDAPSSWFNQLASVVLTVQAEVAERFVAKPGSKEYSQITLLVNYFCCSTVVAQVSNDAFYPSPKVNSTVVKFQPLERPSVSCSNPRLLRRLIKLGFAERRKMLKNNLQLPPLSPEDISAVYRKLNFDPQVRAERVSLQQFAILADALDAMLKDRTGNE